MQIVFCFLFSVFFFFFIYKHPVIRIVITIIIRIHFNELLTFMREQNIELFNFKTFSSLFKFIFNESQQKPNKKKKKTKTNEFSKQIERVLNFLYVTTLENIIISCHTIKLLFPRKLPKKNTFFFS